MRKGIIGVILSMIVILLAITLPVKSLEEKIYKTTTYDYDGHSPVTITFDEEALIDVRAWEPDNQAHNHKKIEVKVYQHKGRIYTPDVLTKPNFMLINGKIDSSTPQLHIHHARASISLLQFDKYREQAISNPLGDDYHVVITVPPEAVLSIQAGLVRTNGVKLQTLNSSYALVKHSELLPQFIGQGDLLEISDSQIHQSSQIQFIDTMEKNTRLQTD